MKTLILLIALLSSQIVYCSSTREQRIIDIFNSLRSDNTQILDDFYHPNLKFADPLGPIDGLDAMKNYYKNVYKNVKTIRFEFDHMTTQGNTVFTGWNMFLSAQGLNGGNEIRVIGASRITFDPSTDLVIDHRDYFDMGEFIYERVPVLGSIIRFVKEKFTSEH